MSTTCPYCNNSFANQGNLNRHVKTAQYCLDMRANGRRHVVREVAPRPVAVIMRPREKCVKKLKVARIGGKTVDMRTGDKYVNVKQLGDALGVKASDWKELEDVSKKMRDVLKDVEIVNEEWWHPDLAIAFAQSVSVKAWLQLSAAQRA